MVSYAKLVLSAFLAASALSAPVAAGGNNQKKKNNNNKKNTNNNKKKNTGGGGCPNPTTPLDGHKDDGTRCAEGAGIAFATMIECANGDEGFDDNKFDYDIFEALADSVGIELDDLLDEDTAFVPYDWGCVRTAQALGFEGDYHDDDVEEECAAFLKDHFGEQGIVSILQYHIAKGIYHVGGLRQGQVLETLLDDDDDGIVVSIEASDTPACDKRVKLKDTYREQGGGEGNLDGFAKVHNKLNNIRLKGGKMHVIKALLLPKTVHDDTPTPPTDSECDINEPSIEVDIVEQASGERRLVTYFLNKDEPQVNAVYSVQDYQTGSLETPPGFSASFSTDGGATFRDVEPLGSITDIKVEGQLPPNPGVSLNLPAPVAESVSQVGGGGDGFAPLILGRRVYYMNHHQADAPLRCTLMNKQPDDEDNKSATNCPGFETNYLVNVDLGRSYYSGNAAVGYADRINNRIYIPVNTDNIISRVGVLCIHIPDNSGSPELCPNTGQIAAKDGGITFTTDGLIEFQNPLGLGGALSNDVGFGFADQATERLYFSHTYQQKMYCLSVANPNFPAPCKENFPLDVSDIVRFGAVIRMTVMPKTDRFIMKAKDKNSSGLRLRCYENPLDPTIAAQPCPDWENDAIIPGSASLYQYESIPIPNSSGVAIGFCVWPNSVSLLPKCFHLDTGLEAAAGSTLGNAAVELKANRPGASSDYTLMNTLYAALSFYDARVYFTMGAFSSTSFGCYDGKTGKKCENYGYEYQPNLSIYGTMVDVGSNGECIWAMGDRGILVSFSAADPSRGCGSETPTVEFSADDAYCGPDAAPEQWTSVTLLDASSGDGDFDSATLTIFGSDGTEVLPGTAIDEGIPVDISSLPIEGTTSTLRFQVELTGAAEGLYERADPPKISVQWEGPPPQVCFVAGDIDEVDSNLDVCYDEVPEE